MFRTKLCHYVFHQISYIHLSYDSLLHVTPPLFVLSQEADGTVLKIHQGCLDRKTVGKKYDDKLCEVMERAHAHGGRPFTILVS